MAASSPLRVLHVYSGNLYGGIETFLRALAEERDKCPDMQPEFALCFEGRIADEIRASGATLHMLGRVRLSRPWSVLAARRKLAAVLRRRRPDVVICHAPWPLTLFGPVVRAAGVRLVFYRHDIGGARDWINVMAARVRPDLVVANSKYTARTGHPTFPGVESLKRFYVIAPPPPRADETKRAALRRTLGAEPNDVVILQASRMQAWKGQSLLVDALGQLPKLPPWKCWVAGDAQRDFEKEYVSNLKASAVRLGIAERVHFLGQRSDVADLLGAADVFCQPNAAPEPFGIVFVEALAAGLPIATTEVAGGALEIVDESCSLVSAATPAGVAQNLRALICDAELRKKLGHGAHARAAEFTDTQARLSDLFRALSQQETSSLRREAIAS